MSIGAILARVGGLRGLAAGAAIAWGTSQATNIATEAQERTALAEQQYAAVIAMIEERDKELSLLESKREELLESMRAEAYQSVIADIAAGTYDTAVWNRVSELQPALKSDAETHLKPLIRHVKSSEMDEELYHKPHDEGARSEHYAMPGAIKAGD